MVSQRINYKKELEDAARTMILVHKPSTLIKLIVRMIVRKVKVSHAGILLYDHKRNSFILTVSGGTRGSRIPPGFVRLDPDNAIIQFFTNKDNYRHILDGGAILNKRISAALRDEQLLKKHPGLKDALLALREQMQLFEIEVCIPSYFHNRLLGILLLGRKVGKGGFYRDELNFFIALAHDVAMAIQNAQLFEELQREIENKKRLFLETTKALATTIDAKDHYTHGHTERVTHVSLAIAKKLIMNHRIRVDEKFMEDLNMAALLHDIGKIGIPETILNKKGFLDDEERKRINEHPLIGASILEPIQDFQRVREGVKYHHERYDGKGYPEGKQGKDIPLISSIISVADSYDAMTTHRPYRAAFDKQHAVEEVKRCSGTQFNPMMAETLLELYHDGSL